MAPKKSGKKKSKKTLSASQKEWSSEGGVHFESDTAVGVKRRRFTQEKDERYRRGRLKLEIMKREKESKRHLATKVNFRDFINSTEGVDQKDPQVVVESYKPPNSSKVMENFSSGEDNTSIVQKLQQMIRLSNIQKEKSNARPCSSSHIINSVDVKNFEPEENFTQDETTSVCPFFYELKVSTDLKASAEKNFILNLTNVYTSRFSTGGGYDSDHVIDKKWIKLVENPFFRMSICASKTFFDLFVDKNLIEVKHPSHNKISIPFLPRLSIYSDIPGLHKVYDPILPYALPEVHSYLLPYLAAYMHGFFEIKRASHMNDVMSAVMLHTAVHILRARYTQMKQVIRHPVSALNGLI